MIVYLPLEKIDMRYTSHLDRDVRKYLAENNIEHIIIEPEENTTEIKSGSFLDAGFTIMVKSKQMYEVAKLFREDKIKSGDIIFTTDIWFPAIESIAYLNYFHNKDVKLKGVLHAGSFTDTDFVRDLERWAKNFEDVIFDISSEIFVASNFIKQDVIKKRMVNADKITISSLPLDFESMLEIPLVEKQNIVVFNGRNVDEKQPWLFEKLRNEIQKEYPHIQFVNTHQHKFSKTEYYELLRRSKVVVSFALQENFGYGIQEAVYLGNVPVLPNRLVYKEQFDKKYLYSTFDECVDLVVKGLSNRLPVPNAVHNNNNEVFSKWFKD